MATGPSEPGGDPAGDLVLAAREVTTDWLRGLVSTVCGEAAHRPELDAAVETIVADLITALETLFNADVEHQTSTPLTLFRDATRSLTAVLLDLGYQPGDNRRARDGFLVGQFPDDVFGLVPATWSDIDESMVQPGLAWGAWKAMTIIGRRNPPELRDRRDAGAD